VCVAGWVWTVFPPAPVVLAGRAEASWDPGEGEEEAAGSSSLARSPDGSSRSALDRPTADEGSALLANTLRDPNAPSGPARRLSHRIDTL